MTTLEMDQRDDRVPVIGEKLFCRYHKLEIITQVCSSSSCKFRVLCNSCINNHNIMYPYHESQIVDINQWFLEYKKISKQFNPRSNYQAIYQIEEIGCFLKKEKKALDHAGKMMDDAFKDAVGIIFEKIKSIKEKMNETLWKDFLTIYDKYNNWIESFGNYPEQEYHNQLYVELIDQLKTYHTNNNLKGFFDKAYTGYYEEKMSNKFLDINELLSSLRKARSKIEEGFPRFDKDAFNHIWEDELNKLSKNFDIAIDTTIFQSSKHQDLLHKLPVVQRSNSFQPEDQSKLSCLVDMQGCSSHHIRKFDDESYVTVSENRMVHMFNPLQNFKLVKKMQFIPDPVSSCEVLKYERKGLPSLSLLLLGGEDECPNLELYDLAKDKSIMCYDNAHAYGLAELLILKKETRGALQIFWIASTSADGDIKIWTIEVKLNEPDNEFEAECTLKLKVIAHDDIISAMVLVPRCPNHNTSSIITASLDKSFNIWEWESELADPDFKFGEEEKVLDKLSAKYMKRVLDIHHSRIKSVVLISDKEDYSDLTYFATGAGDGMISVWNNSTKELVKSFSNQKRPVFSMEYVKNNKLACSANDRELKQFLIFIWDWTTTNMICYIKDHNARIQKIISLEKNLFASCDKSEEIKIWYIE